MNCASAFGSSVNGCPNMRLVDLSGRFWVMERAGFKS